MKKLKRGHAGQRGAQIRSDCFIEIALKKAGGINVQLRSKVASMYGEAIRQLLMEMCQHFALSHADIFVEDSGALPFTLAARFETALRRVRPELSKEFLPPFNAQNISASDKNHFRRSRLYLPGNEPKFMINAGLHLPDGLILDLEDSVAPEEKDAARRLVRNALRSIDFRGAERMVRLNQGQQGLEDLRWIVPHRVQVILLPKCESAQQVLAVENAMMQLQAPNPIHFIPIIESALGVVKAYEIASASEKNCALAIGLEDYTADLGVARTAAGRESLHARSAVINAAKAAGLQALDSVFSEVNDVEGLKASVAEAKALGFEGKGCIHPRQIRFIHEAFAPTPDEIAKARQIVFAFEQTGRGVAALDGKMIDAPVVKQAQQTLALALRQNLIAENWRRRFTNQTESA